MLTLKGHSSKVRVLAFVPGSNHLLSAAGHGTALSRWDLARGKRSFVRGHHATPMHILFTPSGRLMVTCDDRTSVLVWDAENAVLRREQAWLATLSGETTLALIGDFTSRTSLRIDDLASGATRREAEPLPDEMARILGLTASRDGRTLAATFDNRVRHFVRFFHPDRTPMAGSTSTLDAIPYAVAFSPDGGTLVVGTTKSIQRIDVTTAEPLPALREHRRMLTGLAYLPDGRLLSSSTDGTVRTWEGDRCRDCRDWQLGPLTALAVASDGMRAAVGSDTGEILVWDVD